MYNVQNDLSALDVQDMTFLGQRTPISDLGISDFARMTQLKPATVAKWFSNFSASASLVKRDAAGQTIQYYQGKSRGDQIRLYAGVLLDGGMFISDRGEETTPDRIKQYDTNSLAEAAQLALEIVESSFDNVLAALWTEIYVTRVNADFWTLNVGYQNIKDEEGSGILLKRKTERLEHATGEEEDEAPEGAEFWD